MRRSVRIALAVAVLAVCFQGEALPSTVKNGRLLMAKRFRIETVRSDGSGTRVVARGNFDYADAAWSPDKSRILYREGDQSRLKALWVMDDDGGNKRQLVAETLPRFAWSPNMRRVVYVAEAGGDVLAEPCTALWILHLPSETSRMLTEVPGCGEIWNLTWSPAGDRIAFVALDDEERQQVFVITVADGELSQLTVGPGHNSGPVWSPAGDRLAFESTRDHEEGDTLNCLLPSEIYVMRSDGSSQRRVTSGSRTHECFVHWAADGRRLALTRDVFRTDRSPRGQVAIVGLDGAVRRRLTPRGLSRVSLTDVSPDGRWVLYDTHEWRQRIEEWRWFVYRVSIRGGERERILGPTVWPQPADW